MANPVETWKAAKHGLDAWADIVRFSQNRTSMKEIDTADLERMKWHGVFYRKRDGDGTYMLRIRLTGCELSADQALVIAAVARDSGYGIVDLTTRANIQIQGLPIEQVPAAIQQLAEVGLTARQTGHDNIRNVFGHPFSGIDPTELIDTRALCREITDIFINDRTYSDLPRKFNIAISGAAQHGLHYWSQDISYLACRTAQGEICFQVLIGGTQGQNPHLGWHLPVLARPEQVVPLTRALLDLFRDRGSREKRDAARFRYLIEDIGVRGVLSELEHRLPFTLQPSVCPPPPPGGYEDLIGWFPQQQSGKWTMGLCVPLGRLSWMQLEAVAHASQKWADGTLRATHEQGLVVTNIPAGFRDALATHIAGIGLSPHGDTLDRNTVACTGKQFCNIGVTETKSHMLQLVEKLRRRALALHGIRIHMSGCPASCAQHHTADIGLKGVRVRRREGTREGFDVYLGGGVAGHVRLGLPYKLGVDADQLPQLIEDVVREYYQQHLPGYTFSAYWFEKLQGNDAAKVVDGEYQAPIWLCESCQHQHVGIDPPVFCPKCSALRRNFARLEDDLDFADDAVEPVQSQRTADGYIRALPVSALVEGEGRSVELEGQEYAVFLIEGQVYTIDNACSHSGGPLAQGQVDGHTVSCPWHGWTFNACSGCSLSPAGHDVRQYETRVVDGTVFIRTPQKTARGSAPQRTSSAASRPRAASTSSRTAAPVSMS